MMKRIAPLIRPALAALVFVSAALLVLSGQTAPAFAGYKTLQPVMVSLIRDPAGKPGAFFIHMTSQYGQSGCQNVGKVGYKVVFEDMYMDVSAYGYTVDMDDLPLHPEYQCGGNTVYPAADVPLTLDMLRKNQTQMVRFQDTGETDYYYLMGNDTYVTIIPQPPKVSRAPRYQPAEITGDRLNPLKLWFYPRGTVILRANDAPEGFDPRGNIDSMARVRGLVPLETVLKGFTSPVDEPDSFYYAPKTKKGRKVAQADGIKDGVEFGVFTVPATVYGAEADERVERTVHVYAHAPGINE